MDYTYKLIIAGGRKFDNHSLMFEHTDEWFKNHDPDLTNTVILSGAAKGADRMAIELAYANDIPVQLHPANWDKYGKLAGFKRNEKMIQEGTHLLAFWDGKSRGTRDIINRAQVYGVPHIVIVY